MTEQYLMHYGVLGQKWGIRRYQNSDGTLTPAGKARYREDGTKLTAKNMTDKELEYATSRLRKENEFNSAKNQNDNSHTQLGAVGKLAVSVGIATAGTLIASKVSGEKVIDGKKLLNSVLLSASTIALSQIDKTYGLGAGARNLPNSNQLNSNQSGVKTEISSLVGSPANSGAFSSSDENRWQSIFKQNSGYDESTKDDAKKMRKAGYDMDQIERYLESRK